jgi:rare lipoprotein A
VGAYADRRSAEQVRAKLETRFGSARLVERPGNPPLWRVLVGSEPSPAQAAALARRLRAEIPLALVVPLSDTTPRERVGRK